MYGRLRLCNDLNAAHTAVQFPHVLLHNFYNTYTQNTLLARIVSQIFFVEAKPPGPLVQCMLICHLQTSPARRVSPRRKTAQKLPRRAARSARTDLTLKKPLLEWRLFECQAIFKPNSNYIFLGGKHITK